MRLHLAHDAPAYGPADTGSERIQLRLYAKRANLGLLPGFNSENQIGRVLSDCHFMIFINSVWTSLLIISDPIHPTLHT